MNTQGSYYCDCIEGYVKSGVDCVPSKLQFRRNLFADLNINYFMLLFDGRWQVIFSSHPCYKVDWPRKDRLSAPQPMLSALSRMRLLFYFDASKSSPNIIRDPCHWVNPPPITFSSAQAHIYTKLHKASQLKIDGKNNTIEVQSSVRTSKSILSGLHKLDFQRLIV